MEDGKLITAKHNEDGSSSVGLLNGKLGETRENVKTSRKTNRQKLQDLRGHSTANALHSHTCQKDPTAARAIITTEHRSLYIAL